MPFSLFNLFWCFIFKINFWLFNLHSIFLKITFILITSLKAVWVHPFVRPFVTEPMYIWHYAKTNKSIKTAGGGGAWRWKEKMDEWRRIYHFIVVWFVGWPPAVFSFSFFVFPHSSSLLFLFHHLCRRHYHYHRSS